MNDFQAPTMGQLEQLLNTPKYRALLAPTHAHFDRILERIAPRLRAMLVTASGWAITELTLQVLASEATDDLRRASHLPADHPLPQVQMEFGIAEGLKARVICREMGYERLISLVQTIDVA